MASSNIHQFNQQYPRINTISRENINNIQVIILLIDIEIKNFFILKEK